MNIMHPQTVSNQQQQPGLEQRHVRVLIIGAGPAGLRAARELAPHFPGEVLVVERESQPGGIPRHSDHLGYGLRDLFRVTTGPRYARSITRLALSAGAEIRCNAMVTGWAGERSVLVTEPHSRSIITADAIILATGTRERPRSARLIPGDRTQGVLTTGMLQNAVHIKHQTIGKRAVILGAELVSWSAAMTLAEAKCKTVALVSSYEKPEAYGPAELVGKLLARIPVHRQSKIIRIIGKPRVTGVEIEHILTGERSIIECDTVVLSGSWIPDHELARSAGIPITAGSKAPEINGNFQTNHPGIFAIGNLVHPADMHDICALDGKIVAPQVRAWLDSQTSQTDTSSWNSEPEFSLSAGESVAWVSPASLARSQRPTRSKISVWLTTQQYFPLITATQNDTIIGTARLWWPGNSGRVTRVPRRIVKNAQPGIPVVISLRQQPRR